MSEKRIIPTPDNVPQPEQAQGADVVDVAAGKQDKPVVDQVKPPEPKKKRQRAAFTEPGAVGGAEVEEVETPAEQAQAAGVWVPDQVKPPAETGLTGNGAGGETELMVLREILDQIKELNEKVSAMGGGLK